MPFVMTMCARVAAPVTLKADGCFQLVGLLPAGAVHVNLNLSLAAGAGSTEPLKTVAHLFALPAMLNLSDPTIEPNAIVPALVTHGLAVLPSAAFTVMVSTLAAPVFLSGGEKVIAPFHTPSAGLHVTVPGWFTGNTVAPATPIPIGIETKDDNATAVEIMTILRRMTLPSGPNFGRLPTREEWTPPSWTTRRSADPFVVYEPRSQHRYPRIRWCQAQRAERIRPSARTLTFTRWCNESKGATLCAQLV